MMFTLTEPSVLNGDLARLNEIFRDIIVTLNNINLNFSFLSLGGISRSHTGGYGVPRGPLGAWVSTN